MEEQKTKSKYVEMVINPQEFLPNLSTDLVHRLSADLNTVRDDFEREIAIVYIAGNYSTNKHLCGTVLRGKTNDEIFEIMDDIRVKIDAELESRKKRKD